MTSSHTMLSFKSSSMSSSFKSRRFDSSIKSSSFRNVTETRVKFKTFSQTAVSDQDESNEEVRRCISYIKEQKLVLINYATITLKTHKDESTRSINKYVAAKNFEIISAMIRN